MQYMKNERAEILYKKYLDGHCTPEEQRFVEQWYLGEIDKRGGIPQMEIDHEQIKDEMWSELMLRTKPAASVGRKWYPYAAAAAVVIGLSAGLLFYMDNSAKNSQFAGNYGQDVKPGGNKAYLTLSDGSRISLSDAKNGKLANQAGVNISKTKDGQLIYTIAAQAKGRNSSLLNTITTPNGGEYAVNLPDGSRVWLNAASSLTFPVQFSTTERRVTLKGEGYFEVAKDKAHPFRVATGNQLVEVLGTHFDINGYADETTIKTTLLEGSVHVLTQDLHQNSVILKPGEQSLLFSGQLAVRPADLEAAMAWKNGLFMFSSQDLAGIMKQVSRWYDVEVEFENEGLKKEVFKGTISKFKNVSQLLEVLESTGSVHFKVEGRRITAMQ